MGATRVSLMSVSENLHSPISIFFYFLFVDQPEF